MIRQCNPVCIGQTDWVQLATVSPAGATSCDVCYRNLGLVHFCSIFWSYVLSNGLWSNSHALDNKWPRLDIWRCSTRPSRHFPGSCCTTPLLRFCGTFHPHREWLEFPRKGTSCGKSRISVRYQHWTACCATFAESAEISRSVANVHNLIELFSRARDQTWIDWHVTSLCSPAGSTMTVAMTTFVVSTIIMAFSAPQLTAGTDSWPRLHMLWFGCDSFLEATRIVTLFLIMPARNKRTAVHWLFNFESTLLLWNFECSFASSSVPRACHLNLVPSVQAHALSWWYRCCFNKHTIACNGHTLTLVVQLHRWAADWCSYCGFSLQYFFSISYRWGTQ